MADLLDTTARQVRLPRGTVHRLTTTRHDPTDGQRYTTSCIWPHLPPGYWRAQYAVDRRRERALLADRCCRTGDEGHPGPCATLCLACGGGGRCPDCGGVDDLVEDVYMPRVVDEHAFAERGLL